MSDKTLFINTVHEAIQLGMEMKTSSLKPVLMNVYNQIISNPFLLWDDIEVGNLGKVFLIMNHFDLFDDEATNIAISHLAYFFISRGMQLNEKKEQAPESYNKNLLGLSGDRIMILNQYGDSFTDTLAYFFTPEGKKMSEEQTSTLRKMIGYLLPTMVYYDFVNLDIQKVDFSEEPYLSDTVGEIETNYTIGEKDISQAIKLHKALFGFIHSKLQKRDYDFYSF